MARPNLFFLRLSFFLGMIAAVVTLLYLAPVPDQSFKNCDRPCHELDWPMICRFKLTIEKLPMSVICQDCQNSTNCSFCSSPNDIPQEILTANRQLPAPAFQVCHNDIVIVDVTNKLQGQSLTMHWRGQGNVETPFMDGVPLVTQCPIGAYTTFQYKFRASSPGTHSYGAFSDSARSNGLYGAFVVRKPEHLEQNREYFDEDDKKHVIVLSESRDSLLVNGVGPSGAPLSIFPVKKGTRNLFRVIYASSKGCSVTLTINNHLLKVVALDGNPVSPMEVSSVKLTKGETLDFVLNTNQPSSSYFIKVRSHCNAKDLTGQAILSYEGTHEESKLQSLDLVTDFTKFNSDCEAKTEKSCFNDIKNVEKMDQRLMDVDTRIYLGFDRMRYQKSRDNTSQTSANYYYRTNNISFTFPPSPILTQPGDIPVDLMCNESYLPDRCQDQEKCECVHLHHIPVGSKTEIVLVDQGGDDNGYIFHLRGYQFYVVGTKIMDKPISKQDVEVLDANFEFIKRNLDDPVRKVSVRVPKNGIVAVRFVANNPGFWMLRDENAQGWTRGLDMLFQVGDTGDIVPQPSDFPTCGNFIGPDFFLL